MGKFLRRNAALIFIIFPLLGVCIATVGTISILQNGYPMTRKDFTVEDRNDVSEISKTLANAIIFNRTAGIRPYVDPSQWDKLDDWAEEVKAPWGRCGHPVDPVLDISILTEKGGSFSTHLICNRTTFSASWSIKFDRDETGQIIVKDWGSPIYWRLN